MTEDSSSSLLPRRSTAEWTTFIVALVIVVGVVAAIATRVGHDAPANPVVTGFSVETTAESTFLVHADIHNDGDLTAADVAIRASMTESDGTESESEQVIDFLSGDESVEVVFSFAEDPADHEVEIVVAGFTPP